MILSHQQLLPLVKGALSHRVDENGYITFLRFTQAQIDVYSATIKDNGRAICSAGIMFDFFTDSKTISFKYKYGARSTRKFMSIDLYEENVLKYTKVEQNYLDTETDTFEFSTKMQGLRRVTIHLPYSVELKFISFELEDNAQYLPNTNKRPKVLFIGDSITHGYDAELTSYCYVSQAARSLDAEIVNQGIAAYIYDANMVDKDLPFDPDAIVLAYGTNDWDRFKTVEEFKNNLDKFFEKFTEVYKDTKTVCVLPIWRSDIERPHAIGDMNACHEFIRSAASINENISFINGLNIVPPLPRFFGDLRSHPNDLGFVGYAEAVVNELRKVL